MRLRALQWGRVDEGLPHHFADTSSPEQGLAIFMASSYPVGLPATSWRNPNPA